MCVWSNGVRMTLNLLITGIVIVGDSPSRKVTEDTESLGQGKSWSLK